VVPYDTLLGTSHWPWYRMVILKYQGGSKLTYPLDMVAIFIIDRHKIEQNRCERPPKEQQCHV
jgi:hypothetical protein